MKIVKCYLKNNPCYKAAKKRTKTTGIVKHSTGANNPNLSRYIGTRPELGVNKNNNDWNRATIDGKALTKCVHFLIGRNKDGDVVCYQILPLEYRCWGCGKGSKGSYNDTHIQYEILEDGLNDKNYYTKAFKLARELDAYLCKKYNLDPSTIVGHFEASKKGYASNHADPGHWLSRFGGSMAKERAAVKKLLDNENTTTYVVKKGDTLSGIATKYKTTWKKLAELNNIKSPYTIVIGQKIKIK